MSSLLVINRVCRLEIQSAMLVVSTNFVNYTPSKLLSGLIPPPRPFPVWISTLYCIHAYSVQGWGSMGASVSTVSMGATPLWSLWSQRTSCLPTEVNHFKSHKNLYMYVPSYATEIQLMEHWVGNLSHAMERGIDSRNRIWNWVAKLHRLAGRYDNPMPTWFLAPIAGLQLPSLFFILPHALEIEGFRLDLEKKNVRWSVLQR